MPAAAMTLRMAAPFRGRRHVDENAQVREAREEIRHTRERMSETLDQLGERLHPDRVKAELKSNIREATVGRVENMARQARDRASEAGTGIMDTIRENPMPAAMVAVGLGWLFFSGRNREERHARHALRDGEYVGDISATTPRLIQDDAAGGMGASVSGDNGRVDHLREQASGAVNRVQDRLSGAGERAGEVAHNVRERASGALSNVRDRASNVATSARERAHTLRHSTADSYNTNPMALGAVAAVIGLAAGLAVPETRRESELMGDARDRMVDRARGMVDEARGRVEQVASRVVSETKETVREVARDEGLTS
jgi:ElaB/YqjD/DUF883 family membrane-anchored ribosome-binding protein